MVAWMLLSRVHFFILIYQLLNINHYTIFLNLTELSLTRVAADEIHKDFEIHRMAQMVKLTSAAAPVPIFQ